MVAPVVAAGLISAGASIFSGITGGKGAKKAATIAANSAAQDRALAQSIYNNNVGMAQPALDRGNAAGAQINALLGLGGNAQGAQDALAAYRGATGYQTRLEEGQRAINTGYAARGALESGAAQKALLQYGQNQASGSFNDYVTMLQNQQGVGQNALGSITGSGIAYVNQATNANQGAASAAANAALYGAQAQQNALAGLAYAGGQLFGNSSYGQRNALPAGAGGGGMVPGYGGMTPGYGGRNPWG